MKLDDLVYLRLIKTKPVISSMKLISIEFVMFVI